MNKNRLLPFITLCLIVIIMALYKVNVMPIVKDNGVDVQNKPNYTYQKGESINPLKEIAQLPNLEIYIFTHRDDLTELPTDFPKSKILYTDDRSLVENVIDNFNFIYTGSDMSTCESIICVKSDNKVVYKANIVISKHSIGLQSPNSGWIKLCNESNLIKYLKDFAPVYKPIVVI